MKNDITAFSGEYRWLSNFWILPNWIEYAGYKWATTEQAYQAMKISDDLSHQREIMSEDFMKPGQAKRYGNQNITIRSDWDLVKIPIMTELQVLKFESNPDLMEKLLETKGRKIIEGNTWGDTFWGECPIGTGRNELGKIIMAIRDDITR